MIGLESLTDAHVRELAKEIVHRPEFARWREIDYGAIPILGALRELLEQLGDMMQSLLIRSPLLFWALFYGLALVALLLIAHLVWTIRVALRASHDEAGAVEAARGTDFIALADELAAASRFLDAAHCLQLACIEQLLRRRLISLSRSEPNRTLRHRLSRSPVPASEQSRLIGLLDQTETAWFRDRSQDPVLYDGWKQMLARLSSLQAPAT